MSLVNIDTDPIRSITYVLSGRGYSGKTIKAYCAVLKNFIDFCEKQGGTLTYLDVDLIKMYIGELHEHDYAPQTIAVHINAIKFYYKHVSYLRTTIDIPHSKKTRKLPVILSREEIKKILMALTNRKHRLMIALAYGAGLRVSEVVNMKVKDVHIDDYVIHLKHTKGMKERITIVPEVLLEEMKHTLGGKELN